MRRKTVCRSPVKRGRGTDEATGGHTTRDLRTMITDWGIAAQTPEAAHLVDELRTNESRLRRCWDSLPREASDALLWHMVAQGVGEALAWEGSFPLPELCERALALRGSLDGGHERLMMRERARILLHLAKRGRELPRQPGDLLAWWDEATRLEPVVRWRVAEPRWRTKGDGLPFTGMSLSWLREPLPLRPGNETADPADIPALVTDLVTFLNAGDLAPEVTAAHVLHLIGYVHPFVDGNGHTERLLTCELLSRARHGAPMLLAYVDMRKSRAGEWCELRRSVLLGEADVSELVHYQLRLFVDAQSLALAILPDESKPVSDRSCG